MELGAIGPAAALLSLVLNLASAQFGEYFVSFSFHKILLTHKSCGLTDNKLLRLNNVTKICSVLFLFL